MSEGPIRVLVVDDHAVVREGIRRVLDGDDGMQVIAEGADGDAAVALVDAHRPDVLVLDVAMPGRTGIEVTRALCAADTTTRILILSMYDEPQYVLESIKAGATGYILKDAPPADLRAAVRMVHSGKRYLADGLAERLRQAEAAAAAPGPLDALTPRELDVLRGVAAGLTNKEIAANHGISPRTVETHREALMAKLEIRTVAGLTRLALEEGLG
jgi:DNA-binding NarL/FixJ family response regulator